MKSGISGKNVVIGITGCIAAYKIPELVRLFVKNNANVNVILTESAAEFVTPVTLSTVSGNEVSMAMFDRPQEYNINHISLADKADLLLVAPATANIIGKIANGIADDLLSTTVMATKAPVMIAPAMNCNMWTNPIVQENIEKLKARGYLFIDPEEGELACRTKGPGRLRNIEDLFSAAFEILEDKKPLNGKKILVTIGGTREYIDPIRFITNKSSGKMGLSILKEAVRQGADAYAISTVEVEDICADVTYVETTAQMEKALKKKFPDMDILIMAAAVADYSVAHYSEKKIKKLANENVRNLELVKTLDLVAEMAKLKKKHQTIVGFAAETEDLLENARKKLQNKKLDLIVGNDVSRQDIGMGSDYNEVVFLFPDGKTEQLPKTTKDQVARKLLEIIVRIC